VLLVAGITNQLILCNILAYVDLRQVLLVFLHDFVKLPQITLQKLYLSERAIEYALDLVIDPPHGLLPRGGVPHSPLYQPVLLKDLLLNLLSERAGGVLLPLELLGHSTGFV
jgi:hypothetical protein